MPRDDLAPVDLPPSFTIDARDPLASGVVMIWACFRNGDLPGALGAFTELAQSEAAEAFETSPDAHNSGLAVDLADAMDAWTDASD